jgi:hypothetical protein
VAERKRIASLGGKARLQSLQAAGRIAHNFRYAAALGALRGRPTRIRRLTMFAGPLQGSIPRARDMAGPADHLDIVGELVEKLRGLGLEPVLVGGMALVVLGSRRVTRDFDFVIAHPGDRLAPTIDLFYDRGLELVSRLSDVGEVTATIATRKVAAVRLRLDAPATAYFFNPKTGLRVDLLFDFPIPAATLAEHATRTTIRSHVFDIASEPDLLRLKRIANAARSAPGDAEDIAFLESRRKHAR